MNDDSWKIFWEKVKFLYSKEDGNIKSYEFEQSVLDKVLRKIEEYVSGGSRENKVKTISKW